MAELNIDIEKKSESEKTDDYNFPSPKSHWEEYQIYYLIFGFFFIIVIILISNSSINSQIKKINERLDGNRHYHFGSSSSKILNYLSRLEKEPFPKHVKDWIKEEIGKIASNISGHNKENREEWIEQVMRFPWHEVSSENQDIVDAENKLNQKHFGLKEVKKMIIRHLAAKKRSGKNLGKVICLVGAPGVGKTTVARSIAEALGRPFQRVSLGGVHDEAEIRGHRNTYISAKPGVIVQAFQRAKVKNPIILADEIDKMGESGHHGNPAAAFLEILDPEQNENFRDHYIEIPVDLSQAMFICSANNLEAVPGPLRDRMEIIELPSYTENEKQSIAKNYLIPELLKFYKLTNQQLTFDDEAIQKIITHYTWEAGIRNLEEALRNITEEFVVKFNKKELESENITAEKVPNYLGKFKVPDFGVVADYSSPGVVNGLSAYGKEISIGDILPIEVFVFSGEGKITATGNLKKTVEESIQVAISYIRKDPQKFGIDENIDFNKKDIHVHIPRGGIPKDGPSAGTAITSAIISALSGKRISKDLGMTGEIILHGKVSVVGGLREKINAAHRRGLKYVFIPESNNKDLDEIPNEIKDELKIIPVNNYLELWNKMENLNLIIN